jgi:hypothetical protein
MKDFDRFIEEAAAKRCPNGEFYDLEGKKCRIIPRGYHMGGRGYIEPDENGKKNGNGNGNGSHNGNGNGNGHGGNGNGSGGNGGSGNGGGGNGG